ncbi:hypothetical protein ERJ75_001703400 [Trypanosoma vivax]|nr:hypothetical protein ERJ75_001703400 [Trypanosoma vivax]
MRSGRGVDGRSVERVLRGIGGTPLGRMSTRDRRRHVARGDRMRGEQEPAPGCRRSSGRWRVRGERPRRSVEAGTALLCRGNAPACGVPFKRTSTRSRGSADTQRGTKERMRLRARRQASGDSADAGHQEAQGRRNAAPRQRSVQAWGTACGGESGLGSGNAGHAARRTRLRQLPRSAKKREGRRGRESTESEKENGRARVRMRVGDASTARGVMIAAAGLRGTGKE